MLRTLALLGLLILCGCQTTTIPRQPGHHDAKSSSNIEEPPQFQYKDLTYSIQLNRRDKNAPGYHYYGGIWAWGPGRESFFIPIHYIQNTPATQRLVIILPIDGSSDAPQRSLGSRILSSNFDPPIDVLSVLDRGDLFDWPFLQTLNSRKEFTESIAASVKKFEHAVIGIRIFLEWRVKTQKTQRVGIAGFSVGAMIASVTMGIDGRISCGALIFPGGSPSEIFASSDVEYLRLVRENALQKFVHSAREYKELLDPLLAPINPLLFVRPEAQSHMLIFNAQFDQYVTADQQKELWSRWGRPEQVLFAHGHKTSFLSITPLGGHTTDRRIARFFDKCL